MSALSTEPNVQSLDRIRAAVQAAQRALGSLQKKDGHWCAELEGDSILQSEYLLMKWILRQEREPLVDGRPGTTLRKIVEQLRSQQRPDGGWGQFPGSGIDISGSVKGYFCLKLAGDSPDAPHMKRAREVILRMGGAERCNSFTNFYLACLGQISWNAVPSIPPEMVWMPRWFYFHLDKMSAWSRTMLLPLAIVTVLRPTRQLDAQQGIDELFVSQQARHRLKMRRDVPAFWRAFFGSLDWIMKRVHDVFGTRWRRRAIEQAFNWSATRMGQEMPAPTSGLGAIFPPMVYIQVVMQALGMSRGEPMVKRAERELDEFMIEEGNRIRLQPCFSPVWDTGIALYALADCGLDATNPMAEAAGDWLRSKEVRHRGDWAVNVAPGTEPGGWFFEYANAWYPDVDDTAMVAMSLRRIGGPANIAAAERGVRWILSMQNDDGGWAAFDKTKDRPIYEFVPFADHNAIQDRSCPDIAGPGVHEFLEALGQTVGLDHPDIRPSIGALAYHARDSSRSAMAAWFGRWGVNYIYGTWQAVIGPIRCGVRRDASWIKRAGAWVKSVQKADGSFGESANSYENPSLKGQGPSTASQTAWAAMILQEIYGANDPDLQRAVEWLARMQLTPADAADPLKNPDGDPAGSWCETEFTGTGFPKVFYLRYHMYRLYFPLMAMGRFVQARAAGA